MGEVGWETQIFVTLVFPVPGMLYTSVQMLFNQERPLPDLLGMNFNFPFLTFHHEM